MCHVLSQFLTRKSVLAPSEMPVLSAGMKTKSSPKKRRNRGERVQFNIFDSEDKKPFAIFDAPKSWKDTLEQIARNTHRTLDAVFTEIMTKAIEKDPLNRPSRPSNPSRATGETSTRQLSENETTQPDDYRGGKAIDCISLNPVDHIRLLAFATLNKKFLAEMISFCIGFAIAPDGRSKVLSEQIQLKQNL